MYCKHCGKEIADDSKFCNYCGNSTVLKGMQESENIDKQQIAALEDSISVGEQSINEENNPLNADSHDCNRKQTNSYGGMLGITLMTISLMTIIVSILLVIPMMAFRSGNLSGICVALLLGSCGYIIGKKIKN